MVCKPLGHTGLTVSPLCFGTLPFSPLQGVADGPDRAREILLRAFELGINFIDTAQFYDNYPALRAALSGDRYPVVTASKTYAHTREGAFEAVEEARRGLDRDVIDIFLLHEQESGHTLRGHAEALEELYRLKAAGIIRAVGLSTHHVEGVRAAVSAGLDVVHPLLNVDGLGIADGSRCRMEKAVADAMEAGLGVYIMKVLGGGNLFRRAEEALVYARAWGHSFALGMRDIAEVEAAAAFIETGVLPRLLEKTPRRLHIADWCSGCGRCVERCKSNALSVIDGKAVCDAKRCIVCGYCGASCPGFCIKIV